MKKKSYSRQWLTASRGDSSKKKKKNEDRNTFTGFKSRLLCNKELDWKYSTRSERKTFKCRLKQLTEA